MKKRTETNIDRLKNQRRLNVSEQLSVEKNRILGGAKYWKQKGIPKPLKEVFKKHKIEIDKSIMLFYEQDVLGGSTDEGMILTTDGFFYEFDADLNSDRTELLELYSFINVSDRFEINSHKKGVGKSYGALAMEVLKELNDTTTIN